MLCEICESILREDSEDLNIISNISRVNSIPVGQGSPFFRTYHHPLPALKLSSDYGCHFCYLMWTAAPIEAQQSVQKLAQQINVRWDQSVITVDRAVFRSRQDARKVILEYKYYMPTSSEDDHIQTFRQHFRLLWPEDASLLIGHSRKGTNTWCTESWEAFVVWMRNCTSHHLHCSIRNIERRQLPSRLLEVGRGNTVWLRVVGRIEDQDTLEYLALSHCWGTGPRLKLKQSTAALLSEGVDIYQLSKTFREAILVTKRFLEEFGVRYLWIDSLCIAQDSADDWRKESAIMGEIYQNAFCTLTATAAPDGAVGIFNDRDLRETIPCTISAFSRTGEKQEFTCINEGDWDKNITKSPVNQRAWVFQERLLSPRILHFGAQQLYWECSELEASEAFRNGFPDVAGDHFKRLLPYSEPHKSKTRTSRRGPYALWDQIVKMYSAGNLTKSTDRLVAISGIAHKIRRRFLPNDVYLAGLWKGDLAFELLWDVMEPVQESSEYVAPTWSWASRSHTIPCEPELWAGATKLIKIKKAIMRPIGGDMMGQVGSGYITVEGILVSGRLSWVVSSISNTGLALEINDRPMPSAICSLDDGIDSTVRLPSNICCLPILQGKRNHRVRYRGLLLVPSDRVGVFKRYGTFTTDSHGDEFARTRITSMLEVGEMNTDGSCEISLV